MYRSKRLKNLGAFFLAAACLFFTVSCEYIEIKTVIKTDEPDPTVMQTPTPTKEELYSGLKIQSQKDGNGRVTHESAEIYNDGEVVSVIYKKIYEYTEDGFLRGLTYENGDSYIYGYDTEGRVISLTKNGSVIKEYGYSDRGYLICEDDAAVQRSYEYSYDEKGNIISRKSFPYKNKQSFLEEYEYKYENGVLISAGDSRITYNTLGNPVEYKKGYSFVWNAQGLRLDAVLCDGAETQYEYGAHGQRSVKIVDGVRYEYRWTRMKLTELEITDTDGSKSLLVFTYTDDGKPIMFTCNGKNYYYKLNISGDVEEILTEEGSVGRYYYDAWGRITKTESDKASDIMELNPIRYRGYVYDADTELYYLHTRYYDPALGRRINADGYSPDSTEGYIYAENNPVTNIDPTMQVKYPVTNELHLYSKKDKPVAGKINVVFKPDISNPVFQIENSYKIKDANQQRDILEYIMNSDMYIQDVYGRSIASMLTEWRAHNDVFAASPNERCRHVDFDRNDEGVSYSDFWKRAMKEYGI